MCVCVCVCVCVSAPPDNFGTFLGHFSDIFRTFFRYLPDILSTCPFSGLSNDLPVTSQGVWQEHPSHSVEGFLDGFSSVLVESS